MSKSCALADGQHSIPKANLPEPGRGRGSAARLEICVFSNLARFGTIFLASKGFKAERRSGKAGDGIGKIGVFWFYLGLLAFTWFYLVLATRIPGRPELSATLPIEGWLNARSL
jgi:hypothetical protein